ncbi:3-oxoacyl-ACP synthase [Polaribacter vadi]|uniref:3-oxoacyl-ACP synthase n=1 Tax=Polaribacter vadi TaxID=1774273 RepID=A0A1B8TSR3_9FLAO|nr:GreA/GreB family elongation factor [Polaribacter vadi]AOW17954.1 3-oxoacyl-ACP synthase [Polaribacter vadi]OBY62680.1 3-oxoacyl-ACP synthase [Polaribacter vadi]
MSQLKTKELLFNLCKDFVNKRLQTVEEIISSNQKGLQSETKSSAGDKHETGRAMLQLEMEKASQQLEGISIMNQILSKVDISKSSKIAHLGSVIITNKANYFLSISAGQLSVKNNTYFAISISSPIGKLLLGKKENEEVLFNGNLIKIKEIF